MNTPNLDYSNLKDEHINTDAGFYALWEEQVRLLEKQYNEDSVIKNLRQQRIDILEKAIPVDINWDYSYIYDEETQKRLDYLGKVLNDYIMDNYINSLHKISYDLGG